MDSPKATGKLTEARVERWLLRHGLESVARNYSCRGGELDLVMLDEGTLVFVEVRLRSDARFGSAAESVDARKQARVILAARHFLARNTRYQSCPCRFDVVAVDAATQPPRPTWIRDAFSA